MLIVNLITVGKLKEQYLRDACKEYIKRLGAFCKINIIELSESKLTDNPSVSQIENALNNESKAMYEYIALKNCYNISMCIEGRQVSSVELSRKLENVSVNGKSTVNFFIGSSYGIHDSIKTSSNFKLSMSKMTFPHQLARVMLLEQIYRAFQISNNGKYHK